METKDEGKSEKTFRNFGKKVDQFMDELNQAGEKLQKEFHEKYEDLKLSAEKLKKEAENKERWKEVENNLKKAGDELSKAFKAAFKKNQEEKKP
jgi:phosphoglycerate-specific signal transduction histidine kinase